MKVCIMHLAVALIMFLSALQLAAEDLHLENGRVLTGASLRTRRGNTVTVVHSKGTGTYRLTDFTKESQEWFKGKLGTRYVGGMHPINDKTLALARQAMDIFCTNQTVTVMINVSTRKASNKIPKDAEPTEILHMALRELYANYLASELSEEELKQIIAIYNTPVMKKYIAHHAEVEADIDKLVNTYFEKHPEKATEFANRLQYKSKRTGLYYIELDKIGDEVFSALKEDTDKVLGKYLTADEIAEMRKLQETKAFERLSRAWMRDELTVPDMWKRYLKDHPEYSKALAEWWTKQ